MRILVAAMLALAIGVTAAHAEDCKRRLARYAKIPFSHDGEGRHISLPATLGGRATRLVLDTGAYWSVVRTNLAEALDFKIKESSGIHVRDASGKNLTRYAIVPSTKVGSLDFGEAEFFAGVPSDDPLEEFGGSFGQNLMTRLNLEIDNAGKSVSFYAQDHCPGLGVHWADEAVVLPYKRQRPSTWEGSRIRRQIDKNQIDPPIVWGDIDGERIAILFDTGSTSSLMDEGLARRRFNITASTPGAKPAGKVYVMGGDTVDTFSYTFKSLTISRLQFSNIPMLIGKFDHNEKLILGMNEMRNLHLYFDFKEGAIYVTAADATKTPPTR